MNRIANLLSVSFWYSNTRRRRSRALAMASTLILCGLLAGSAEATSHVCERVAPDLIEIDGLLDDWRGAARHDVSYRDRDASFTLRCGYDDKRLYISVRVFDEYLYRRKRPGRKTDDHLIIALSSGRSGSKSGKPDLGTLIAYPGNDKAAPHRLWNGRKALPGWIALEDSQQRRGWALEVAFEKSRLKGLSPASPGIDATIRYNDADIAAKVEGSRTFQGRLEFADQAALLTSFLAQTGLKREDIAIDRLVNVDDQPGAERVIIGGRVLGILGTSFSFMELPVDSARDVLKAEIVDLRGDGTRSIVTTLRQRGNGGSRDIVAIWQAGGGQFDRVLAFEIRKQMGDRVLANRWSLIPRGSAGKKRSRKKSRKAGKGHDVLIEVSDADATGWDEDNFREAPAVDVRAILLPWAEQTSAVYSFEGNSVRGGGPAPTRKR